MPDKTFLADPVLYRYALDHSVREPDILRRLREETATYPNANMQISPDQGELFALLVRAIGAKKVLEVGVFTGYSSLAVLLCLPPEGRLQACDISDDYTKVARRYWREAGVADRVDLHIGPAADTLKTFIDGGHAGTFDFAFIDADKTGYDHYYECTLQLLRRGGLMALDNMLQSGKVVDPTAKDPDTVAIRALNDKIAADPRVFASLLPLADGITIVYKK
jgi:predicted O-methyltransferase YrrM